MGQRCFPYGLDTARGQGQVESCSLANVRSVIHSLKMCLICSKRGAMRKRSPQLASPQPAPIALLSSLSAPLLAYLPRLFQPLPSGRRSRVKLQLRAPVRTVQVVEKGERRGGGGGRGGRGGIRSAEFWWLFFCFVYPLGPVPAVCAKGRREIR